MGLGLAKDEEAAGAPVYYLLVRVRVRVRVRVKGEW